MRVVYEAENLIDAHLVKGLLEDAGIPTFVRGEFLTGAMGELPVAGMLAVCVPEASLPAARDLLADWKARPEAGDVGDESGDDPVDEPARWPV